jgi:hypothetical protein
LGAGSFSDTGASTVTEDPPVASPRQSNTDDEWHDSPSNDDWQENARALEKAILEIRGARQEIADIRSAHVTELEDQSDRLEQLKSELLVTIFVAMWIGVGTLCCGAALGWFSGPLTGQPSLSLQITSFHLCQSRSCRQIVGDLLRDLGTDDLLKVAKMMMTKLKWTVLRTLQWKIRRIPRW